MAVACSKRKGDSEVASITATSVSVSQGGDKLNDKNRRSRKFQITINNPDKHKNCSHDDIKKIMERWDNIIYYCMCDEIGTQEETLHTHIFVQYKNPVYFNSIKSAFEKAHIEEAKGTVQENRQYIRKEGKWEKTEKEHFNLKDTFEEFGTIQPEGQGRRTDLADLYQMIKDGYNNIEILEINPDNILNLQQIDKARLEILYTRYKGERRTDICVTYVSGSTGLGKSRDILDMHMDENVYRVTDYKHPFDSYSGEDVIVFEEFRSDLLIGSMLNYLDIYPIQLPARYNNKQACYHYVYIVSNWKLEDQYKNVMLEQPETYKAFLRRIHNVRLYKKLGKYMNYSINEYMAMIQNSEMEKDNPFRKEGE